MESKKIGLLILLVVGIIVATILIPVIANQLTPMTTTVTYNNQTQTAPAVNATINLIGQDWQGTPKVYNYSSGADITANFTIQQSIIGQLPQLTLKTTDKGFAYANSKINVTYISEPVGYAEGSSQAIIGLIIVLVAMALVLWTLGGVREQLKEMF